MKSITHLFTFSPKNLEQVHPNRKGKEFSKLRIERIWDENIPINDSDEKMDMQMSLVISYASDFDRIFKALEVDVPPGHLVKYDVDWIVSS